MEKRVRWENHIKVSAFDSMVRIAKALPDIRRDSRAARKILHTLEPLSVDLALPDNEQIMEWIEQICQAPHRRPGSPGGQQAEEWAIEQFNKIGLENVSADPVPINVWTPSNWSLEVEGQPVPCFFTLNTGFTGPGGVTAPLVYVGAGRAKDFDRVDVKDKIVVAETAFPPLPSGVLMKLLKARYVLSDPRKELKLSDYQYLNFVRKNFVGGSANADEAPDREVYWQAQKRGAAGICLILKSQPAGTNTHYGPYDGLMKPMPGLWIGKYEGKLLRSAAKRGASATLVLDGEQKPGEMRNIWGVLPGMSEETILVTSHLDSPFQGAVEDASGIAQVMAQAKAWSRIPKQQRPRTIVFVAGSGHFYGSEGGHAFARTHADLMQRTRILITLEHMGGKEVRENGAAYETTGRLALSVVFTSPDAKVIASVMKALETKPAEMTAAIPSTLFGPVPTTDAMGYVLESGVPVISWIGCPYYLLDEHDTLDKIDVRTLHPLSETVGELIKIHMNVK
jgi:hypothetical protein